MQDSANWDLWHAVVADCNHLSLAVVDQQQPHVCSLLFVSDSPDGSLAWVSAAHTRHSQALATNVQAAISLAPEESDPSQLRGIQMHGVVECAKGVQLERWRRCFAEKHQCVNEPAWCDMFMQQPMWSFSPKWVRIIDNRQGPAWSVEWLCSN